MLFKWGWAHQRQEEEVESWRQYVGHEDHSWWISVDGLSIAAMFRRRGLDYEFAGLISFTIHERYIEALMRHLTWSYHQVSNKWLCTKSYAQIVRCLSKALRSTNSSRCETSGWWFDGSLAQLQHCLPFGVNGQRAVVAKWTTCEVRW